MKCLSGLGVRPETYGMMLTPVLLSRFRDDIRCIVAKEHEEDTRELEEIHEILRVEVTAGEKCLQRLRKSKEQGANIGLRRFTSPMT